MKKPFLGRSSRSTTESFMAKMLTDNAPQPLMRTAPEEENPLYTGRFLVTFDDPGSISEHRKLFSDKIGMKVASTSDFGSIAARTTEIDDADVLIYENLGVALVGAESDEQVQMLAENASSRMIIEPELVVYVPDDVFVGFNTDGTWGIIATKTNLSQYSGNNVKIAVLDTGLDLNHPDFAGRTIYSKNFVDGEAHLTAQDGHGHGTHCIGTACGNTDDKGKRYGVAGNSIIYAGKVLNNMGRGAQQGILDGMDWAVQEGCKVISMSLGSKVYPGQGPNAAYERAAADALSKGCIVVAAAGNDSRRSLQSFYPVGSPANCPSVMAVAALDSNLNVADFSNRGINSSIPGGSIDIAAPGVDVYSSWPMGMRYRTISGTSMATPHVAGILALLWEANPKATPQQIIGQLNLAAQKLTLPVMDVGAGLAIAP